MAYQTVLKNTMTHIYTQNSRYNENIVYFKMLILKTYSFDFAKPGLHLNIYISINFQVFFGQLIDIIYLFLDWRVLQTYFDWTLDLWLSAIKSITFWLPIAWMRLKSNRTGHAALMIIANGASNLSFMLNNLNECRTAFIFHSKRSISFFFFWPVNFSSGWLFDLLGLMKTFWPFQRLVKCVMAVS